MSTLLPCFKAYDIRGRVPDVLNAPLAHALGRTVAEGQSTNDVDCAAMPAFPGRCCAMPWQTVCAQREMIWALPGTEILTVAFLKILRREILCKTST